MKLKKNPDLILRSIAGETVLIPTGKMASVFNGMINLNDTGAFMWKFFSEEHTLEEGVAALRCEYDVEEERARQDIEKFMNTVQQNGFAE